MSDAYSVFLAKAEESLIGAESEFANGRYNNCANRCYYAGFQAAIAALIQADIGPRNVRGQWGHDFVRAEFVGQLINRRKVYPSTLRDVLERSYSLRHVADYQVAFVTETQAARSLRRIRQMIDAILEGGIA